MSFFIMLGIKNQLGYAVPVSEVNKYNPAMVSSAVDPSG
jgi:hypothetical protein